MERGGKKAGTDKEGIVAKRKCSLLWGKEKGKKERGKGEKLQG